MPVGGHRARVAALSVSTLLLTTCLLVPAAYAAAPVPPPGPPPAPQLPRVDLRTDDGAPIGDTNGNGTHDGEDDRSRYAHGSTDSSSGPARP